MQVRQIGRRGFTLVELVAVLAIAAMLASIIVTSFSKFRSSKVLDTTTENILSVLSMARGDTISAQDGYQYGVHFESSKVVKFRGATYSSGDSVNEIFTLDSAIEVSSIALSGAGADVVFDRLTGKTSQPGTVTVRIKNDTTKTRTITILGTGVASGT